MQHTLKMNVNKFYDFYLKKKNSITFITSFFCTEKLHDKISANKKF